MPTRSPTKEEFLAALLRTREREAMLDRARQLGDIALAVALASIHKEAETDARIIADYLGR